MWEYTDKVLDLFYNPQHQGTIEDKGEPGIAVATGEVGSIACGDALRLHLKIDVDLDQIIDAKFQTFGCTSAIASSEALIELIKGLTLDDALQVTNKDIANHLGGLPSAKMHCSVMGQEALEAAIYKYRGIEHEVHEEDDEGALVCTCFSVTENKIRRIITENKLTTAEEVTNYIKAGGGCGSCLATIDDILESVQSQQASQPAVTREKPLHTLTTVQKIALIQKVLDEEVRPVLIADGGDVELYDVEGETIKVILQGACGSCSSSTATLKIAIEARLRDRISPNIIVQAVDRPL